MANLIYMSGQNHHNVFINKTDNKLYSFGKNQYGQLGLGDTNNRYVPTLIDFEFDGIPSYIQQGYYNTLVITNTGKVYSFGWNQHGQLGLGDTVDRHVPTLIDFQFDGTPIIGQFGDHYVLILTDIGKVYSFGYNGYGNLGLGDTANRNIPHLIDFEFDGMPLKITQGNYHSFIAANNNKVYSFGWNNRGQLGLGDTTNRNIPTLINYQFDGNITNIQQGGNHSLILTDTGKVYTFGWNNNGQLGLGDTINRNIPILINFEFDGMPVDIQQGEIHSLVLTDKGKVYSFGDNGFGALGIGNYDDKNIPTLINFDFDGMPVDIRAGDHHSIIFTDTNKVYSFGRNDDGQLGLGDTVNRNIPTLIENFNILTSYILILSQNLLEAGIIKVDGENISIPYSKKFEQNTIINIKQIPNDKYEFVKWNEL